MLRLEWSLHAYTAFAVVWQKNHVTLKLSLVLSLDKQAFLWVHMAFMASAQLYSALHLKPVQESQDAFCVLLAMHCFGGADVSLHEC